MLQIKLLLCLSFIVNCLNYAVLANSNEEKKSVICYISSWAVYRKGLGKFTIDDVDPTLCTHAVYAYFGLNENSSEIISRDEWGDFEGFGQFQKFIDLKEKNPHLKLLTSVGGWAEGSIKFSDMSASSKTRATFIDSIYEFVKTYKLDGIEISWQFPSDRGGVPEDKANFVSLLKELRTKFQTNYLLAVLLNSKRYVIDRGYDLKAISDHVDLMNLLTFEYSGPWTRKTGINSPLRGPDELNVEFSIDYFIKKGANPSKMMISLPTFGHAYIMDKIPEDGEYFKVPIKGGFESPWTRDKGVIGYHEVCYELSTTLGWKLMWHEESSTPFAVNNKKLITYDNVRSISEKIKLLKEKNLGGAVLWKLDIDDFKGNCGTKYPILKFVSNQLMKEKSTLTNSPYVISHAYG